MARRPRPVATAPVTWRDGVHLTGTPIWCDARRRRDVCFVSCADRVERADHGQLIATGQTLGMLGAAPGHLAPPLRQPFTLGTLRLELIRSGGGFGAAALLVDPGPHSGARRVLYAGIVRTRDTAEPAEVRSCDAVVVHAPVGQPHHVLPALDGARAAVHEWASEQLRLGRTPALVVDSIPAAFEVVAQLAGELPLAGSRAVREAAERTPSAPSVPAKAKVQLRLARERVRRSEREVTALVSLRALERPAGFDAYLPWPFAAGRDDLLAWIEQTGARTVYVTGASADAIAGALGPRAHVLGPPQQLALFGVAR